MLTLKDQVVQNFEENWDCKGLHLYDGDYDFDEMNSEIALMFGDRMRC